MNMNIIRAKHVKNEVSKVSGDQRFFKNIINKDLRIILKRCDFKENRITGCTINEVRKLRAMDLRKASLNNKLCSKQHVRDVHNAAAINCPRENCEKYIKPIHVSKPIRSNHEGLKWHCTFRNCSKFFFS